MAPNFRNPPRTLAATSPVVLDVRRLSLALVLGAVLLPSNAGAAGAPACSAVVSDADDAAMAVGEAAGGDVVCLQDGTYGLLTLRGPTEAPGVTVTALHPGKVTAAGATLEGSHVTLSGLRLTAQVTIATGSAGMTVDRNLLIGRGKGSGNYGVFVCPAEPPDHCDDVSITRNRFQGRFDEDAIRANVYHDGPDPDHNGLLVEGNEFTGNVEYGGHNDVFQSVWVGDHLVIRRNYIHDFGGQGIFVKDQAPAIEGLVIDDNLIVRQDRPCDPKSLCPTWQLSPLQVFGPLADGSISHNTIWTGRKGGASAGGPVLLRDPGWSKVTYSDNVIVDGAREASAQVAGSGNTRCSQTTGPWIALPGSDADCSPPFRDPAHGDYTQAGGRGVTWKVSDQSYGPVPTVRAVAPAPVAVHHKDSSDWGWFIWLVTAALAAAILATMAAGRVATWSRRR
jgi:hypothetical protein